MIEDVANENKQSKQKSQPIDLSHTSAGNWVIAR